MTGSFINHETHEMHENIWQAVLLNRCFSRFSRHEKLAFYAGKTMKTDAATASPASNAIRCIRGLAFIS